MPLESLLSSRRVRVGCPRFQVVETRRFALGPEWRAYRTTRSLGSPFRIARRPTPSRITVRLGCRRRRCWLQTNRTSTTTAARACPRPWQMDRLQKPEAILTAAIFGPTQVMSCGPSPVCAPPNGMRLSRGAQDDCSAAGSSRWLGLPRFDAQVVLLFFMNGCVVDRLPLSVPSGDRVRPRLAVAGNHGPLGR